MSDITTLIFLLTIVAGLLVVIALGLLWRFQARPKRMNPASPLIPTQEEMRKLYAELLAGNAAAAELWLRGAIYWESQLKENGGFTPAQALAAALDPDIGRLVNVEVR